MSKQVKCGAVIIFRYHRPPHCCFAQEVLRHFAEADNRAHNSFDCSWASFVPDQDHLFSVIGAVEAQTLPQDRLHFVEAAELSTAMIAW